MLERWEILDRLSSLVDKSLVVYEEDGAGQGRYRLMETVRQYARDHLLSGGEGEALRDLHAVHFLALAEENAPRLGGAQQADALDLLAREHENLRAAQEWLAGPSQGAENSLRLALAIWRFCMIRGFVAEGLAALEWALTQPENAAQTVERAKALNAAGSLAFATGNHDTARARYTESLETYRALDRKPGIAFVLGNLGILAWGTGDYAAARALQMESLALQRELDNPMGVANTLNNLGLVAWHQGDYEEARSLYAEGLATYRAIEYLLGIASALANLGQVLAEGDDLAAAEARMTESLELWRTLGNRSNVAYVLGLLGGVALQRGDIAAARGFLDESLAGARDSDNAGAEATALCLLGRGAITTGDCPAAAGFLRDGLALQSRLDDREGVPRFLEATAALFAQSQAVRDASRAAHLLGAADRQSEELGTPLPRHDRPHRESWLAAVRAALGEAVFAKHWAAGRACDVAQAVAFAQNALEAMDAAERRSGD